MNPSEVKRILKNTDYNDREPIFDAPFMNFSENQASHIEERAPKAEWSNLADAIFNPGSQQN